VAASQFFQHECYIHAGVPRIKNNSGKVKLVEVPWAQTESSFSLLVEYDFFDLISEEMSMKGLNVKHW